MLQSTYTPIHMQKQEKKSDKYLKQIQVRWVYDTATYTLTHTQSGYKKMLFNL